MLDLVLFAAFPYVAVILAVVVGVFRYFNDRYSFSSHSSQFLENKLLFRGSVPWHYGIILVLAAHLLVFLFAGLYALLIAEPIRLYVLEIIGMALGLTTVVSVVILILRRAANTRLLAVTTTMDWVLLVALLSQVVLGVYTAFFYRWGSAWYIQTAVPWLMSLVRLSPQVEYVSVLPWVIKAHFLGGFVITAIFPFTRLVHLVAFPLSYLWRPYQVVIWNRR